MIRSDLCDSSYAYIVVKGHINVTGNNAQFRPVYQKSLTHLQTMQKILILLCQYIIC